MLAVISPAKNLDLKPQNIISDYTIPDFLDQSQILIESLRNKSAADLAELFSVNSGIAQTNFERFHKWHFPFTPENAKQAALLFNGEVYNGLKAKTMTREELLYLQDHLRILSGLYGVLRPLDLMQAYRLEMGTKLETTKAADLYAFWGNTITEKLNEALAISGKPNVLVNLASSEYFKSVKKRQIKGDILNIEFLEHKNGQYKTIVVYTKKARGMMVRYIVQNRIDEVEDLKGFDSDGYIFNPRLSKKDTWVFTRG